MYGMYVMNDREIAHFVPSHLEWKMVKWVLHLPYIVEGSSIHCTYIFHIYIHSFISFDEGIDLYSIHSFIHEQPSLIHHPTLGIEDSFVIQNQSSTFHLFIAYEHEKGNPSHENCVKWLNHLFWKNLLYDYNRKEDIWENEASVDRS